MDEIRTAARRMALVALGLMTAAPAMAITLPGGNLGNQSWAIGDSPVVIQSDATIQAGATLTIDPGVVVQLASGARLTIEGTIDAGTTGLAPVTFRGPSTSNGSWYGLVIAGGVEGATLTNVEILDAQFGVYASDSATLSEMFISGSSQAGLYVNSGTTTFSGSTSDGSTYGIWLTGSGQVNATDCIVADNGSYGIFGNNSSTVTSTFDHCTLYSNTRGGFYADISGSGTETYRFTNSIVTHHTSSSGYGLWRGDANTLSATNTVVWKNLNNSYTTSATNIIANPIYADAANHDFELTSNSPARNSDSVGGDIGAVAYDTTPTPGLYGTLWEDTTLSTSQSLPGDLTVAPGVTLTVDPGVTMTWSSNSDIMEAYADTAKGELRVLGTLDAGVSGTDRVFKSTSTSNGTWSGIAFLGTTTDSALDSAQILDAVHGLRFNAAGDFPVSNALISGASSAGVLVQSGRADISDVRVTAGSTYGVHLTGRGEVDALRCIIDKNGSYGIFGNNSMSSGQSVTSTFDYCTLYANTRGGFYADISGSGTETYNVTNSLVTDHTSSSGYGLWRGDANTLRSTDSLVWNNLNNSYTKSGTEIIANPLYADAATGDFELTSNSPARRPDVAAADMGAVAYDTAATPGLYGTLWTNTTVSSNTTLPGDLTVAPGRTLTLQAGVTLTWQANSDIMKAYDDPAKGELRIDGRLWALGTAQNPVVLKSTSTSNGTWQGLHFRPSASGALVTDLQILDPVRGIRYTASQSNPVDGVLISGASAAGVYVDGGNFPMTDVRATAGSTYGIHLVSSGEVTATRCIIDKNGNYGVFGNNSLTSGSSVSSTFDHCTLDANTRGGFYADISGSGTETYTFSNSIITNHTSSSGYGLWRGDANTLRATNSVVWKNLNNSYTTSGTNIIANPLFNDAASGDFELTHRSPARNSDATGQDIGATPYDTAATPGLYGTLWSDLTLSGPNSLAGDLTVAPGVTLTIDPGSSLTWTANSDIMEAYADTAKGELRVLGTLEADATLGLPVTLKSTSTSNGTWYGVHVNASSQDGVFRNLTILDAVYGLRHTGGTSNIFDGLIITGASSAGVLVDGGAPLLDRVRATDGSTYGFRYTGSGQGDVTNCIVASNGSYGFFFSNSLSSGNSATVDITNCTVDDNTRGGFYADISGSGTETYNIVNTVISNHDSSSGYGAWRGDANTMRVSNSVLFNNINNSYTNGGNVTTADPLFLGVDDYHLSEFSPLIDTGTDSGAPDHDVDGRPRPVDGDNVSTAVTDIGAYEFQNVFPGITLVPGSVQVAESGTQAVVDVVLDSPPSGAVILAISSSDTGEATVAPASLSFDSTNWSTPQAITVTGVDDDFDDGDIDIDIRVNPSSSPDIDYQNVATGIVDVLVLDDDTTAFIIDPIAGLTTTELGGTDSFTVKLGSDPGAYVRIDMTSSDTVEGTVFPPLLEFTSADWDQEQTVTVRGQDDGAPDGDQTYTVTLDASAFSSSSGYAALTPATVEITNIDDETGGAGITVVGSSLTTTEAGGTDSFSIVLDSPPTADVVIAIGTNNASEAVADVASLTFTSSNYDQPQIVTVTGQDDAIADGDQGYTIAIGPVTGDSEYSPLDPGDIDGTNTDDDTAGVTVSKSAVATDENALVDSFTIRLDSEPQANVTIDVASSDTGEATVDQAAVVFTPLNWFQEQVVVVTGVDDDSIDGDIAYTVTLAARSLDTAYDTDLADLTGENVDNDVANVVVDPTSIATGEDGTQATFTVVLTAKPSATVTVTLLSTDPSEGTLDASSLTFTDSNWDTAQTVTVTGEDDSVDDGDVAYTVQVGPFSGDSNYAALTTVEVAATNIDDDGAGILVNPIVGLETSETGTTDTFTVVLTTPPTADVTIGVTSSDPGEAITDVSSLVFTNTNWDSAQTVTITGQDDGNADGDVVLNIELAAATSSDTAYDGTDPVDPEVTNLDDEGAASIVFTPSAGLTTTEAGGTDSFDVTLANQPTADVEIDFASGDLTEGTIDATTLTFTASDWDTAQTVTITGVDDSDIDGDVAYTVEVTDVRSTDAAYDDLDATALYEVDVTNTDDDAGGAGIFLSRTSGLQVTEAGGTDSFAAALLTAPTHDVTVFLSSDDVSEGTVSPASLVFTTTNWSTPQTVTVTGVDDADVDGDVVFLIETDPAYSLDPAYLGHDADDVEVTNLDDDTTATDSGDTGGSDTGTTDSGDSGGDSGTDSGDSATDSGDSDTAADTGTAGDDGGCNCSSGGSGSSAFAIGLLALALRRRREH